MRRDAPDPFVVPPGGGATDLSIVVDELCGIVTDLGEPEMPTGAPADFICTVAAVADTRRLGGWYADRIAAGTAFDDAGRARDAAIGEAIERYCGNLLPPLENVTSFRELTAAGERALGPAQLPSWSPTQLARSGFPYVALHDDTRVEWVSGRDSLGCATWAPASWVYLNYHHGPRRELPRINHLNYSGIATGTSVGDAARRGLAELVERDAMVTWWYSGAPANGIDPHSIPGFVERWLTSPLQCHLVLVPTDLPLPVVGAYVHDPRTGVPAAGFSAAATVAAAADKAVQEALQVWISTSGLLAPDGASWRAIEDGIFAAGVYLPHREDRHYLDDAGEDFRHVRDLAMQTQLWLDPRLHALAERFTSPPDTVEASTVPEGSVDAVIDELLDRGIPPVAFNLTATDIAETGAATVRVLAPGLQPNAPAAYQYLATGRLETRRRALWPGSGSPPPPVLAPPPHN